VTTSLNFELIKNHNAKLSELGMLAEQILYIDPGSAITRLRSFAEEVTKDIYAMDGLPKLPQATFMELLKSWAFLSATEKRLQDQIHFLRLEGNETAHGEKGTIAKAFAALGTAHSIGQYLAVNYYGFHAGDLSPFVEPPKPVDANLTKKEIDKVLEENEKQQKALLNELELERKKRYQAEATAEQLQKAKARSAQTANSLEWDEATTRKLLIDTQLAKAGWDVSNPESVGIEVDVNHQHTNSGKGYVDYVLWGDNKKPLAVVEAKRPSCPEQQGREQAVQYAQGLAKDFNCPVPIVFYTNGFETHIWDTEQYNTYRRVYGYYAKASLERLFFQRENKQPNIEQENPKFEIAGFERPYQVEAIKAVAKEFQNQRRKALIVQATGTGKTRVSIAIVELLMRTRWVKRVLFLCDRKELRRQADDAFKDFLETEPRCVIGETNKLDHSARVYVATYPGMMNRFSQLDVGYFDLIIADESHRSIYNKYRDIFDYFDAMQLGLTATPVKFIARNTFDLFGCENGDPTFNFDLTDAISHEPRFLNPFKVKEFTTEFLREGIHYNQLSDEQKTQLEQDLGLEEAKKAKFKGKDLGRKIYSEETDKAILENLMNNGIKDATNSLVGKTIVFAQNQKHAEHLEKLFCQMYENHGAKVCKVIHNKVDRPESRIDGFKDTDSQFRIAISVDMMDTGIDVPSVVNLVFARPIKSWVKFWQMVGRGTRLCEAKECPNLLAKDKEEFLIFDHYGNFNYFEEEYVEAQPGESRSLLQTVFEARLTLANEAINKANVKAFELACKQLKADVCDLPEKSIAVQRELRNVKMLQHTEQILEMSGPTKHLLESKIAPLMGTRTLKDRDASMFDRLMAQLSTAFISGASELEDLKGELISLLQNLAVTITEVRRQADEIEKVQTADYWQKLTYADLEQTRVKLRSIMKYKKPKKTLGEQARTTHAEDGDHQTQDRAVVLGDDSEAMAYKQRIKAILQDMLENNAVLEKIRNQQTVTEQELESITSAILAAHPGIDLNLLNEY
jgi:type I restriction enzyme R subunit